MKEDPKPFLKGYKFRIYPTEAQKELFNRTFGCCRYVYNRLLSEAKDEYKAYLQLKNIPNAVEPKKAGITGFFLAGKVARLKALPENSWLNDVSSVALQQTAFHLEEAFTDVFRAKEDFPKFKKKRSKQSFTLMQSAFRFINGKLYVAKSKEPLEVLYSRKLPSYPTSLTISRTSSGKYFVSFLCSYMPPKTSGTKITGVDMGLTNLITLSDGTKIANLRHYARKQKKLRRLQKSLARKKKGSINRKKANILLAQQHERIANCRNDQLHKLTRRLINENQVIGLESLVVRNMIKNRRLSKNIQDVSWSKLLRLLTYKAAESQHCTIVLAHRYYPSSHLCSVTGKHLGRKLELNERTWQCPHCGQLHDRDVNAAINLAKEAARTIQSAPPGTYSGKIVVADAN